MKTIAARLGSLSSAVVFFSFLTLSLPAGATDLTVRVYSDSGHPVVGARASVQRTVATSTPYNTYGALTDAQGKFTLTVPDTATYSVCVGSWSDKLLTSCEWGLAQSLVTIAAGQKSASMNVNLVSGAMFPIRLNDPQNLLPAANAVVAGSSPTVRFGVWSSDGRYHAAIQTSSDSLGQNHQLLVPLNAALQVSVQATGVQVLDQAGKTFASAPAIGFQSAPSAIIQGLVYTVAKLANQ
jgi:hypothetical protein